LPQFTERVFDWLGDLRSSRPPIADANGTIVHGRETLVMSYSPLIFIAVCSGDKALIAQWAAGGDLPNMAQLLETGYSVDTQSLPGVFVGANWPSLQSACGPGKNRVYSWEQLRPGTYDMYRCKASDHAQMPPFWERLSEAGKRICVFDIPHSRLSKNLNGLQTVEWGAHDAEYGFRANSQQLHDEIIEKFGLHPVPGDSDADRSREELLAFCDELQRGARLKGKFSRYFLDQQQPDFFAQVFTEAHCGGHLLWHLHDPTYRWHQGSRSPEAVDSLKLVYQAIDDGIGELLQSAPANANIVLLFSHGMGPMANAYFMTEEILLALGVAEEIRRPEPTRSFRQQIDPVLTWGWQQIPGNIKKTLQPAKQLARLGCRRSNTAIADR
jgi:predicted AlkP superfamily phosphohydrolase/phosphomutase